MCPFCVQERCTRSHRTGTCQHAFPKGETLVRSSSHTPDTHSPNLYALQDRDPEPLALPWPAWELRSRQQGGANPCLADIFGKGFCCTHKSSTDQCPQWRPTPFRAVFCFTHETVTFTVTRDNLPPLLKSPMSPSSEQVDGKDHVSSTRERQVRKGNPCHFRLTWEE